MRPHIVFVHIGPSLPAYLEIAVVQARRFNDCDIWLLAPDQALKKAAFEPDAKLRTVSCEALGLSDTHRQFNRIATLDIESGTPGGSIPGYYYDGLASNQTIRR